MEQPYPRKGHCHTIFIAGIDYIIVTDGAACLCYIFNAALVGTFDIVAEGEESIRT
jgi:hypothetical protein